MTSPTKQGASMSNKTTAILAKLALDVTRQREQRRKAKTVAAAKPVAVAVAEPQRPDSPIATPLAQGLMREMFAMEDIVRGVFADLHQELRGKDGEDAKPEQIEANVRAVFREMAPGLKGKDGKSVTAEQVETLVRAVFNEHKASLKGEPGQSADMAKVNAMVKKCLADMPVDTKSITAIVQAEVQTMAPELRGTDGKPGLVWQGQWVKTREYQPGDVVRFRGSSYVALIAVVGITPGTSARHWDVVAKAGQDGGSSQMSLISDGGDTSIKWTLVNTAYPHFGYTHATQKWKIERIGDTGAVTIARPDNNSGIEYAAAWESRLTLNYATS